MIGYKVGSCYYFNRYLAEFHSWKSKNPIVFLCRDEENDAFNWSVEPNLDLDSLMVQHAKSLRDKYQRLILNWSGGTDSHTIYNVFVRNKIHIDEIVVKYSNNLAHMPSGNVKWLKEKHPDPSTEITAILDTDTSMRARVVSNKDWAMQNFGDFGLMNVSHVDLSHVERAFEKYQGFSWKIITGYEKPQLYVKDGLWYTRQFDVSLRSILGYEDVDSFFLEPTINIKQSHMLKRYLKVARPKADGTLDESYFTKNPALNSLNYWKAARALGRDDELRPGASYLEKGLNVKITNSAEISTRLGTDSLVTVPKILGDRFDKDDATLKLFMQGLYQLASDTAFVEHLNTNCVKETDHLFALKPIWSKSYCIGA